MGSLKNTLRKVLGEQVYTGLVKMLNILNVGRFYRYDRKKYAKYAFGLRTSRDHINLRSKITLNYHALEKGLTNINFRPGFGKTALFNLFDALNEYISKDFDRSDVRFQTGLSTLQAYIRRHEGLDSDISDTVRQFDAIREQLAVTEELGGVITLEKQQVLADALMDFGLFARSRHSVRDFSAQPLPLETVRQAIQFATTTPSVCNRQAWQVIVINPGETLNRILALQGGLSGEGRNIGRLLVIVTDNRYFYSGKERNQGYVDGGLFSMNLVYALHSLGVATCMLNANLSLGNEIEIKRLLALHPASNLVLFIAAGTYLEAVKVPRSQRDNGVAFTRVVD